MIASKYPIIAPWSSPYTAIMRFHFQKPVSCILRKTPSRTRTYIPPIPPKSLSTTVPTCCIAGFSRRRTQSNTEDIDILLLALGVGGKGGVLLLTVNDAPVSPPLSCAMNEDTYYIMIMVLESKQSDSRVPSWYQGFVKCKEKLYRRTCVSHCCTRFYWPPCSRRRQFPTPPLSDPLYNSSSTRFFDTNFIPGIPGMSKLA